MDKNVVSPSDKGSQEKFYAFILCQCLNVIISRCMLLYRTSRTESMHERGFGCFFFQQKLPYLLFNDLF